MKNKLKLAFAICLGILLLGCTTPPTPYKPASFTGGYLDRHINWDTFRVSFQGNKNTPRETVATSLLYRCAELTAHLGYDYFIMLDTSPEQEQTAPTAEGTMSAQGTPMRDDTDTYTRTAIIRVFNGRKPADDPNAYNALEEMQKLEPQIKR